MKVYYINLAHRIDRKNHIENELENAGIENYERVEAVYVPQFGILGCVDSHIKTLEKFLKESGDDDCVMVLEDDFKFTRDFKTEFKFPDFDWDVLMISGNVMDAREEFGNFKKVFDAQTTSGYIVNKHFVTTLLKNFKDGRELLVKTGIREKFSLDMYWKILQPVTNWYVCDPKFGIQAPSYSDIENSFVNYGT
jgi:GR25 family glycosyltransferase involved in LPS biosynthesis